MMSQKKFYASNLHFNTEMSYEQYKRKMKNEKEGQFVLRSLSGRRF